MKKSGLGKEVYAIEMNGEKWWNPWPYEIRPTPSTGKKPDQNWTDDNDDIMKDEWQKYHQQDSDAWKWFSATR